MSPLRTRMIDDMTLAGLAAGTQRIYTQAVRRLAAHYRCSPDQLSEEEVRGYLLALRQRGAARGTFKAAEHAIMQHAGDEERQQLTERRRAEWQLEGAKLSYAVAVARNPVGVLVGASRMASDTLSELAEKARALMVENDPDAIRACLAQIAEALDVIARETRDPMATVQERLAA